MKVVELMRTHIVTVGPDSTMGEVVDMMDLYQLTSIPVVDSQGKPLGVIDDRAVSDAVFQSSSLALRSDVDSSIVAAVRSKNVSSLMETPPVVIDEDDEVEIAIRLLKDNDLMRIPVTTDGRVTGTLSRIDVCQAILEGQIP